LLGKVVKKLATFFVLIEKNNYICSTIVNQFFMHSKHIFYLSLLFVLLASFQCRKQTINNSVIEIKGFLVDTNDVPLSNFPIFYDRAFDIDSIVHHASEKILNTDENGRFSLFVPEPNDYQYSSWKSGKLIIGFIDTLTFYENAYAGDTVKNNFIYLGNFSVNNKEMNLGTLTLTQ